MKVTIVGPNLPGRLQGLGQFHVHRAGCRDLSRCADAPAYTMEALTARDAVTMIYDPSDFGYNPETEIGPYLRDFHFAPCVKLS